MTDMLGSAGVLLVLFLVVLAVLWFLLPFAVFGIKSRLDDSAEVMKALLKRLDSIDTSLKRIAEIAADDPALSN